MRRKCFFRTKKIQALRLGSFGASVQLICPSCDKKKNSSDDPRNWKPALPVVRMFIRDLINIPERTIIFADNSHFSIILLCSTMYLQRRIFAKQLSK